MAPPQQHIGIRQHCVGQAVLWLIQRSCADFEIGVLA